MNYGVVTDDLLTIDVDVKNRGLEQWKEICSDPTRGLIHTWAIQTGLWRAPRHVREYCRYPLWEARQRNRHSRYRRLHRRRPMQTRERRHVCLATAVLPADGVALAEPPAWLLNLIKAQSYCGRPKSVQDWRVIAREHVLDGARHDTLNRLTGHLIAVGVDLVVARELILAWNRDKCEPPLSEKEVLGAVIRIAEREINKNKWLT